MNVNQTTLKGNVKQKQKQQALQKHQEPAEKQLQALQEEGLYKQVKQDEQLRPYHVQKLLNTPGYGHLTEEKASDMVEQMLRFSCLLYELVMEEPKQQQQVVEASAQEIDLEAINKQKRNTRGSNRIRE
ncbi:hypothetical protein ACFSKU_14805 [Pontibacter silvestris]|uniref:Uncharacterized protein n=1 Tax=Pontibacter silvestris TaxID=2305183 RepID=A0ABW4X0R1_9BACT|nr:hypothetical protein [Pontibacter silvestris]MCC9138914.1 hypothetical protein [Pontibacter silvestris]